MMNLAVMYHREWDVYIVMTKYGCMGWMEPEHFAKFVFGMIRLLEENHPELITYTDLTALEQAERALKGEG